MIEGERSCRKLVMASIFEWFQAKTNNLALHIVAVEGGSGYTVAAEDL